MDPLTNFNRRNLLRSLGCGFGHLAASALAASGSINASNAAEKTQSIPNPLANRKPHFPPRAKRVIFIFMQGGPSHVDTFDYKPILEKRDGEQEVFDDARVLAKTKEVVKHRIFQSPLKFKRHGECGQSVSELFPHMRNMSMTFAFFKACTLTVSPMVRQPCSCIRDPLIWCDHRLVRGYSMDWAENENLPGFITLQPSMGNGGPRNYNNAFLPSVYQGTAIGRAGGRTADIQLKNVTNSKWSKSQQEQQLKILRRLNQQQIEKHAGTKEFDAVLNSYELAWRMQTTAPDLLDLSEEPEHIQKMYGIGQKATEDFGRQCLMARRLCKAGVRFVQVNYGDNTNNPDGTNIQILPSMRNMR